MLLYHITFDIHQRFYFTPRIPEGAEEWDEECEIPRICFAPTIEGCLTALPVGLMNLPDWLEENNNVIKVFTLDTEKYGIKKKNIIKPEELYNKEYVGDAILTGEHWVTQDVLFLEEDVKFIEITGYELKMLTKSGVPKLDGSYVEGDYEVLTGLQYVEV